MKQGPDYYRELLTKRVVLLEQHPCCDDERRSDAQMIRQALAHERPVAELKVLSRVAGLMLRGLDLDQRLIRSGDQKSQGRGLARAR